MLFLVTCKWMHGSRWIKSMERSITILEKWWTILFCRITVKAKRVQVIRQLAGTQQAWSYTKYIEWSGRPGSVWGALRLCSVRSDRLCRADSCHFTETDQRGQKSSLGSVSVGPRLGWLTPSFCHSKLWLRMEIGNCLMDIKKYS